MIRNFKGLRNRIARFFLGKQVNVRQEKRMLPKLKLQCRVMRKGSDAFVDVGIVNISANGMAFVTREAELQKGDRIHLVFQFHSTNLVCDGEILSRQHHELAQTHHLKYSASRFSVRFNSEMHFDFLEMLSSGIQEGQPLNHLAG